MKASIFLSIAALISSPVLAEEGIDIASDAIQALTGEPEDPPEQRPLEDLLYERITGIDKDIGVREVHYADLLDDGVQAGLVMLDECDDLGCAWQLLTYRGGEYVISGASWGQQVQFADAGGITIILSDGVTWAYDGTWIYPYGGLLDRLVRTRPSEDEIRDLSDDLPDLIFTVDQTELRIAEITAAHPGNEKIFYDRSLGNFGGPKGYPFVITDRDNKIIEQGWSLQLPQMFRSGTGSIIIPESANGYDFIVIR